MRSYVDIFFQDPSEVPLPPEEMRIRELRAQVWPDGTRVRVYLEVDPFQRHPSADLVISDPAGLEVTDASIVESMTRKMEITMHLRHAQPGGMYTLRAILFYLPPPPEGEPPDPSQRQVVDMSEVHFETPAGEPPNAA